MMPISYWHWRNANITKWSFRQCQADGFNESMTVMYTKSAILLNVFLPGLNHFAELLLDMISWP